MTMGNKENPLVDPQDDISRRMQAIRELRNAITPETVTDYWRTRFRIDNSRILVPDCGWSQKEISRPMKLIRDSDITGGMIYLPEELTGKEGLVRLGKMYPGLRGKAEGSYTLEEDTPVANVYDTYGWIKVEATSISPNRNTNEEGLRTFAREQGYQMQRETVYVLGSLMHHDLTSQFFDEGGKTWSRLGGSHGGGGVIAACFYPDGYLRVLLAVDPKEHNEQFGGRFEQVMRR